jgi:hypothetical protein
MDEWANPAKKKQQRKQEERLEAALSLTQL